MARSATPPASEVVLGTLAGTNDRQQVEVLLVHAPSGASRICLRQQSWGGPTIGWFDQTTIELEPQQVAQLRAALGRAGTAANGPSATVPMKRPMAPTTGESASGSSAALPPLLRLAAVESA